MSLCPSPLICDCLLGMEEQWPGYQQQEKEMEAEHGHAFGGTRWAWFYARSAAQCSSVSAGRELT
jgi:hypothetical protein